MTRKILIIGILTELFLILLWLLGINILKLKYAFPFYNDVLVDTSKALLYCLPLFLLNYFFFFKYKNPGRDAFVQEKIVPLCKALPPPAALTIAIFAGFGEELFFRGLIFPLINQYLGIILALLISSLVFAWIHFAGQAGKYLELVVIYTFVGMYFALIVILEDALLPAIFTHTIYDFLAIIFVRRTLQ